MFGNTKCRVFSRCVQQDDAEKALKANHMNIESAIGKLVTPRVPYNRRTDSQNLK